MSGNAIASNLRRIRSCVPVDVLQRVQCATVWGVTLDIPQGICSTSDQIVKYLKFEILCAILFE